MVALGLPLLTADYDFWVHPDDVAAFNAAVAALGLIASHPPEEVRSRGRYVLENDEHVDVLAARSVSTADGLQVAFDDLWDRRLTLHLDPETPVTIPGVADLILTKRFSLRPKDLEDIRLLKTLLVEKKMSAEIRPASRETRERLKSLAEQPLPLDEWQRRLAIPLSPEEIEHTQSLVLWFRRRYPTVGERLAYVRRTFKRWTGQGDSQIEKCPRTTSNRIGCDGLLGKSFLASVSLLPQADLSVRGPLCAL